MEMPVITDMKVKSAASSKARLYLDGEFWMTISMDLIADLGFFAGFEMTLAEKEQIEIKVLEDSAKLFCMRSLNWKLQSRSQLYKKLMLREIPEQIANRALDRMVELDLLDDAQVAGSVARGFQDRGYGRRRAQQKMREIGIADEIQEVELEKVFPQRDDASDELERAIAALGNRYKTRDDSQRAFGFLVRRGFSIGSASKAVKTLPSAPEHEADEN